MMFWSCINKMDFLKFKLDWLEDIVFESIHYLTYKAEELGVITIGTCGRRVY